jgi:hypothetical protein
MTTADLANEMKTGTEEATANVAPSNHAPLFAEHETTDFRNRWQDIQASFVDDPRNSVKQADELVASTIRRLAEIFADEKAKLEATWAQGGEGDTEALRQAFRRYRSFFDRLLSA